MRLLTCERLEDEPVERGELVYACAVSGANILRDMREAITNTLGGNMIRYEALLDKTIARALQSLSERAQAQGYDGVLGIRPVQGGALTDTLDRDPSSVLHGKSPEVPPQGNRP